MEMFEDGEMIQPRRSISSCCGKVLIVDALEEKGEASCVQPGHGGKMVEAVVALFSKSQMVRCNPSPMENYL